jgi:hypothetical protein
MLACAGDEPWSLMRGWVKDSAHVCVAWLGWPLSQLGILRAGVDAELQHGNSLAAWRQLLLLVLLHDPTTVKPGPLVPVRSRGPGVGTATGPAGQWRSRGPRGGVGGLRARRGVCVC